MNLSTNKKTQEWLWFVGLWLTGFLTLGAFAGIIKFVMHYIYG